MKKLTRPIAAGVLTLAAVIALAACGSSNSSSTATSSSSAASSSKTTASSTSSNSGTATVVAGTFPQSLDPSIDFTTQGGEVHWLTYLGPYSFAHASGTAGTQIIPAVATDDADRQQRRQDVHVHDPQGPDVFGRLTGEGV